VTPGEQGFGGVPDNLSRWPDPSGRDVVEGPVERASGETVAPSALRASPGDGAHPAGGPHVHVGTVVESAAAAVAALASFADEGLRAGDLTVLSCPEETAEAVLAALGERASGLRSDERISLVGVRPPDALVVIRALVDRAVGTGSGRVRIAALPRYGDDPRAWREGERYEAAANVVLATSPVTALCVYDRTVLPARLVDSARRTHPLWLSESGPSGNPAFVEPRAFVRRLPVPRESVESGPPIFAVDDVPTLPTLRHVLRDVLDLCVPDSDQRGDLHLAVSEVAANAFRHGLRPVSARVWADGTQIVCTVTDRGHRFDDPLAGYEPAHGLDLGRGGMGLWLARKLWDTVDLVAGEQGLTVRLSSRLR
jgi:anti-sigma regulatory factor (Ser/Thr protein kinase)